MLVKAPAPPAPDTAPTPPPVTKIQGSARPAGFSKQWKVKYSFFL